MNSILEEIKDAGTVAIAGHVRADGDCLGSVTALYGYITQNCPDKTVDVFVDSVPEKFSDLIGADRIISDFPEKDPYDVFISLDCADVERFSDSVKYFNEAGRTINIDHHISNTKYAGENHVIIEASSTAEILFGLMDYDKISVEVAKSLYIGIINDTGVFKHSCTSSYTMNVAGKLMDKGLNVSQIIDECFYAKTYAQNQLLGRCLLESIMILDGKVIFSAANRRMLAFYDATSEDLDGIIDQLRVTKGVEVAILVHETAEQTYKVSMRSNNDVDVNEICGFFGGGGHIKAAGCNMSGSLHDVVNNLTEKIEKQLKELEKKEHEECTTE